ncbi:hypothetical protein G7Y79_00101g101480 [Physcia stellaris]|nr:hypothetical protein G7Y79_00101g101480 [Physcia stellaris]
MEDSVGVLGERMDLERKHDHWDRVKRTSELAMAWSGLDGKHLVTTGHDERVRVWHTDSGANALSHFGPIIKNTNFIHSSSSDRARICLLPGGHIMFYPNEKEILTLIFSKEHCSSGSETPTLPIPMVVAVLDSEMYDRITSLAWRAAGDVEMYSAHSDGVIRAWKPRTAEEVEADNEEAEGAHRKRVRVEEEKRSA